MPVKEANTVQVLKWALNHLPMVLTGCAIIGSMYIGWNTLQHQWQEHVAPNCLETPTASACKLDRLERKVDRIEQKLDQVMLIVARRK